MVCFHPTTPPKFFTWSHIHLSSAPSSCTLSTFSDLAFSDDSIVKVISVHRKLEDNEMGNTCCSTWRCAYIFLTSSNATTWVYTMAARGGESSGSFRGFEVTKERVKSSLLKTATITFLIQITPLCVNSQRGLLQFNSVSSSGEAARTPDVH